eukprot:s4176_g2.t1
MDGNGVVMLGKVVSCERKGEGDDKGGKKKPRKKVAAPYPLYPNVKAMDPRSCRCRRTAALIAHLAWCTLVPAIADHCATDAALASTGAALLQRRVALEVPLVQEFTAEMYEAPGPGEYQIRRCDDLSALRNESMLPLQLMRRQQLQATAQEQLRVAEEHLVRHDLNASLLLKLRQLEERRWSQERVPLSLFNPSMVPLPESWRQSPEERWLASFRHMELSEIYDHERFCIPMAISNVMVLAVLDAQFRATRPPSLLTQQERRGLGRWCSPGDVQPEQLQCQEAPGGLVYLGPEDPRLFRMPGGDVMMLYTSRRPSKTLTCRPAGRMYIAEVMEDLSLHGHEAIPFASERLGHPPAIAGKALGHWEKNWGPFLYTDESGKEQVLVEESMDPHIVLSLDEDFLAGEVVYNSTSLVVEEWIRKKFGSNKTRLHGGVAPVLFTEALPGVELQPPFYISILHTRHLPSGGTVRRHGDWDLSVYENYLFAFEAKPPFAIVKVGQKLLPLVPGRSVFYCLVAFPTQMLRVTSGGESGADSDELMILYGAGDATSRTLRLPLQRLHEFLE